jgi:hypothetical protein
MKRIVLFFTTLFLLQANPGFGQRERIINLPTEDERKLHFGYYLGLNSNSYKVTYMAEDLITPTPPKDASGETKDLFVEVNESIGFNLGFIVDLRLHKNINLRFEPGLMSNSKELTFVNVDFFTSDDIDIDGDGITDINTSYNGTTNNIRDVSSTFLHLPLLFKFSTDRLNNIRPYVIGGVSYDYNFSSNEGNKDDNYSGEFRTTTHNFMYEVGIGMDFYFYFFKFSPSIRGVFAINNELVPDNDRPYVEVSDVSGIPIYQTIQGPWTGPIDFLGTRGLYLNLTFE